MSALHIIAVDKSQTVLSKIEELLNEIDVEELDIQLFNNTNDALDFLEDNEVRLVFSSIETDGVDGATFVDTILRKNPLLVSKLFIVTSQKNGENFDEIKGVGAKRFIQKPINDKAFKHFVAPEIIRILNNY